MKLEPDATNTKHHLPTRLNAETRQTLVPYNNIRMEQSQYVTHDCLLKSSLIQRNETQRLTTKFCSDNECNWHTDVSCCYVHCGSQQSLQKSINCAKNRSRTWQWYYSMQSSKVRPKLVWYN